MQKRKKLVDIVDSCKEIDFCNASDEKWNFAETLLSVLEKNIKEIPDEIFKKNGFRREDVLFFATMGDGDYIEEMIETSVKMFNKISKDSPTSIDGGMNCQKQT